MESWGRGVVPPWGTWIRQSQSFKTFNNSHHVSCVAAPFLGKIHQNDEIYKDFNNSHYVSWVAAPFLGKIHQNDEIYKDFENQNHTMSDEELYKADKLQKLAALGRYTILTFSICFVLTSFRLLLPPANEICEGYVFTRVCHSVHWGGVSASVHAGIPPAANTPPGADTPRANTPTPRRRHPPSKHPPPPGADTSPVQCMLGDTVNKRAVCILLECNLADKINYFDITSTNRSIFV